MILLEKGRDFESYCTMLRSADWIADLACELCGSPRLHRHGEYRRKGILLEDGAAMSLPIRRVICVDCGHAPSVVPLFAAAGFRATDVAVSETVARYLGSADATYRSAASWLGLAHSTVFRWVTRVGAIALAALVPLLLRLRPDLDVVAVLPKLVPADERKARSPARLEVLRSALRVLVAGRHCAEELGRGVVEAPRSVFSLVRLGLPT